MNELRHLVKMYQIHRRNWQTLKEKEAYFVSVNLQFPVHFQHSLEDSWESMVEYKIKLSEYLSNLKVDQAKKGINTPPETLMDIEDIEKIIKEHEAGL